MGNLKEKIVSGLKLGLRILGSLLPYIGMVLISIIMGLIIKLIAKFVGLAIDYTAVTVFTFVGIFIIFLIYIWVREIDRKIKEKRNKKT